MRQKQCVLQRVREVNDDDAALVGQFGHVVRLMSSVYTSAFTQHGPFTLFLVTDAGLRTSLTDNEVPQRDARLSQRDRATLPTVEILSAAARL